MEFGIEIANTTQNLSTLYRLTTEYWNEMQHAVILNIQVCDPTFIVFFV